MSTQGTQIKVEAFARPAVSRGLEPGIRVKWLLVLALAASAVLFYVDAYNSSYGFDALEYLVIGRSLLHGYSLYSFIPSKSWGIYALVAAAFRFGVPATHAAVSALICGVFVAIVAGTFFIAKRLYDLQVASLAAALIAIGAVFMELNYLETEGFVYLFGLAAYYVVMRCEDERARKFDARAARAWFFAGVLAGAAFAFKSTAGFYMVAVGLWALLRSRELRANVGRAALFAGGVLVAVLPPAIYFALTGRAAAYVFWTVEFPLFLYPHNPAYLQKSVVKLLWFWAVLGFAAVVAFHPRIGRQIVRDPRLQLALMLGALSMLALTKNQATHYIFQSAGFLLICVARVVQLWWQQLSNRRVWATALAGTMALMIAAAVYLYSYRGAAKQVTPGALTRLLHWNNYEAERRLQAAVQSQVPAGQHVLSINTGEWFYWITDRYPNVPFVNSAEQTTWWLHTHPDAVQQALADASVAMIEFDSETWMSNDSSPESPRLWAAPLAAVQQKVAADFCRLNVNAGGMVLWIRKTAGGCAVQMPTR